MYTDKSIEYAGKYRYGLVALDSSGNQSVISALYPVMVTAVEEEMPMPGNFQVELKNNQVQLHWKINNQDCRGSIVYRSEGSDPLKPITGLLEKNRYTDGSVQPKKEYHYQVRIYNKSGKIAKSGIEDIAIP
jgi:predicted phage tail protein